MMMGAYRLIWPAYRRRVARQAVKRALPACATGLFGCGVSPSPREQPTGAVKRSAVSPPVRHTATVITAAVVVLLLGGCGRDEQPRRTIDSARADTTPAAVQLIDSTIPLGIAGEDGWNYHQSAGADLTGDGIPERVVLMARVELYRGRPAWDDGQPWQVYFETRDRSRTYVYAQRLQLGTLTMRLSRTDQGEPARIVLLEQLPDRMSVYEATVAPTGRLTTTVRYQRDLDPRGQLASPMLP